MYLMYDGVIFDVDGVLVDVSNSFTAAVVDAVETASGELLFTSREIQQLKRIRGFNDDWHVAIAGAAWLRYANDLSFKEFAQFVDDLGGGLRGLRSLMAGDLRPEFEARVTRLAKEAYGGTTACQQLYGFEPETIRRVGRWREEIPLLSAVQIRPIMSRASIVTGRSADELEMAFELLDWRLPVEQVAVSDNPRLNKPNPDKLIRILQYLGHRKTILAGDGRDDLELVRNARERGIDIDFCYIAPEPSPWPDVTYVYPTVTDLLNCVEVAHDS